MSPAQIALATVVLDLATALLAGFADGLVGLLTGRGQR